MSDAPRVSHATHSEDIVLWRALSGVAAGTYIEVGADDLGGPSATRLFHDAGWRGGFLWSGHASDAQRAARPSASIRSAEPADDLAAGWDSIAAGSDIHLLRVAERVDHLAALTALDLRARRAWIVIVEGTQDGVTEAMDRYGYLHTLFDGRSRIYVARERAPALAYAASYPPCAADDFTTTEVATLRAELREARLDADQWRATALSAWADTLTARPDIDEQIAAIHSTLSWRITKPLRAVRSAQVKRKVAGT